MIGENPLSPEPPEEQPIAPVVPPARRRIEALIGLIVAALIVVAVWFIGGRSGWNTIGTGGEFQQVLPKVGEPAPDFATHDVFGNVVRLSDFRGRPVWLMFWGSWCPPCRSEFPDIEAAYRQLEPEGLVLLGVSLREPTLDAVAYAAQNNASFIVLTDPTEQDTRGAYPIFNFPTHIFIDEDGIIRSIVLEDMSEAQALSQGRALLDVE